MGQNPHPQTTCRTCLAVIEASVSRTETVVIKSIDDYLYVEWIHDDGFTLATGRTNRA